MAALSGALWNLCSGPPPTKARLTAQIASAQHVKGSDTMSRSFMGATGSFKGRTNGERHKNQRYESDRVQTDGSNGKLPKTVEASKQPLGVADHCRTFAVLLRPFLATRLGTTSSSFESGGDDGTRTHGLCSAIAALSQLSYIPNRHKCYPSDAVASV